MPKHFEDAGSPTRCVPAPAGYVCGIPSSAVSPRRSKTWDTAAGEASADELISGQRYTRR